MTIHEPLVSGEQRRIWISRMNALLPGYNRWFRSRDAAKQAARQTARQVQAQLRQPVRVADHIYPALGLRHFHLGLTDGRGLRIRFFYGAIHAPLQRGALGEMSSRRGSAVRVSRARPKGYRRPQGVAIRLTPVRQAQIAAAARRDFERKRHGYITPLRVRSGEHIHHAIELQTLTRYPGVFTMQELNALSNMRGIPEELGGRLQLHNRAIRDRWNYAYRLLDAQIVARRLKPGTPAYNRHVRRFLTSARDEIDWALRPFFR